MQKENQQKEEQLLKKRILELSRLAYQRDIITYSDFLNLNELNILHSLPKEELYTKYILFGGYELAERQMAAFLPDALYLRWKEWEESEHPSFPFSILEIVPLHQKYAEALTHRDYLGAMLNLGIERSKIGDILVEDKNALFFAHNSMKSFLEKELTRVRHTAVSVRERQDTAFSYVPQFEEIRGTVASVRLDSLMPLAFASSRTRLRALIEGGKVFVNGKLITSNGYQIKENDVISVRGMGKFLYAGELSKTKKNRIYVVIHKFI